LIGDARYGSLASEQLQLDRRSRYIFREIPSLRSWPPIPIVIDFANVRAHIFFDARSCPVLLFNFFTSSSDELDRLWITSLSRANSQIRCLSSSHVKSDTQVLRRTNCNQSSRQWCVMMINSKSWNWAQLTQVFFALLFRVIDNNLLCAFSRNVRAIRIWIQSNGIRFDLNLNFNDSNLNYSKISNLDGSNMNHILLTH